MGLAPSCVSVAVVVRIADGAWKKGAGTDPAAFLKRVWHQGRLGASPLFRAATPGAPWKKETGTAPAAFSRAVRISGGSEPVPIFHSMRAVS